MGDATGYIAYVRVSTQRQGEHGASLEAQRDAIAAYAVRKSLRIDRWVEERETAAKTGRPLFTSVMADLRARRAAGLILHKIDRGARNLVDWSSLQTLVDQGSNVLFAVEDLDLRAVSDRLSADVQAVVAAHYIRNLRQEALKGIRARLKQGIYPFRAPIGYLDQGAGNPKIPDPVRAPLILAAFELYNRGGHGLVSLLDELTRQGLHNHNDRPVSVHGLCTILRNPFYMGLIRMKKTGETYAGAHDPVVPVALFERVQARMDGRLNARTIQHDFLFRRLLRCGTCGYALIGERKKGRVYYRCHLRTCPETACAREDALEETLAQELQAMRWSHDELAAIRTRAAWLVGASTAAAHDALRSTQLLLDRIGERLDRLLELHLDGSVDAVTYNAKKAALERDRLALSEKLEGQRAGQTGPNVVEFLELLEAAPVLYEIALPEERRRLVEVLTSNWTVNGGKAVVTLSPPFSIVRNRGDLPAGGPYRHGPRTSDHVLDQVVKWLAGEVSPSSPLARLLAWFSERGNAKRADGAAVVAPDEVHDVHDVHGASNDAPRGGLHR